jgi:hypothetical protein
MGPGPGYLAPANKKRANNPMHSSRPLDGIGLFRFFEIDLTRRAKQGQDGIMQRV